MKENFESFAKRTDEPDKDDPELDDRLKRNVEEVFATPLKDLPCGTKRKSVDS